MDVMNCKIEKLFENMSFIIVFHAETIQLKYLYLNSCNYVATQINFLLKMF